MAQLRFSKHYGFFTMAVLHHLVHIFRPNDSFQSQIQLGDVVDVVNLVFTQVEANPRREDTTYTATKSNGKRTNTHITATIYG